MKRTHWVSYVMLLYIVVGSWKGYLALFEKGSAEPCQIFPRKVAMLPEADQKALEEGILVRNQRDLQQLLEDFLS